MPASAGPTTRPRLYCADDERDRAWEILDGNEVGQERGERGEPERGAHAVAERDQRDRERRRMPGREHEREQGGEHGLRNTWSTSGATCAGSGRRARRRAGRRSRSGGTRPRPPFPSTPLDGCGRSRRARARSTPSTCRCSTRTRRPTRACTRDDGTARTSLTGARARPRVRLRARPLRCTLFEKRAHALVRVVG